MDDRMWSYRSRDRIAVGGFHFVETEHLLPFEMAEHAHNEAHFAFVIEGQIESRCGRHSSSVGSGTFSFMPPQHEHRTSYRSPAQAFYIAIQADTASRFAPTPLGDARDFPLGPERNLGKRLFQEYRLADPTSPLMMEGLMLELLATIARQSSLTEASQPPRWLKQAQDILHAEISRNVSIAELATTVGVHPVHLMRSFRQHYGESIGSYMRTKRIELACQHLRTMPPESSLGQLSQALGYSDQSHFNRTFRNLVGITPSQFRNSGTSHPKGAADFSLQKSPRLQPGSPE